MNPFLTGLTDEEDPWARSPAAQPGLARQVVAAMPLGAAAPGGAVDARTAAAGPVALTTGATPPTPLPADARGSGTTPAGGTVLPGQNPAPGTTDGAPPSAARETAAHGPEVSRPLRFKLPPVDDMVQSFQEWQAVAAATPGVAQIVAPQLAAWRNLAVQQHARAFEGDPTESPEQAAAYARHMGVINGKLGKPMTWEEAARIADYVEEREDGATQRFLKAASTGNDKGAQEWIDQVFGQDVTIVGKRPTKVDLHGAQVDDWEWTVKMPDGSQQAYTGTQLNFMYGDQQARVQYAQQERQRRIEQAKLELENARVLGDPAKVGAAYRKLMEVQGVGGVTTANLPAALAPYAPFLGRLRGRESGGDINAVSVQNAVGLDQFTQQRLDDYNQQMGLKGNDRVTVEALKNNVPLQNQIAAWHYPDIDRFIEDNGLKQYLGQTIKGVAVTLDGMRAAAHLGGSPGLKRFLETKGEEDPADGLGTRRVDYLRKFQGETVPLGGGPAVALDAEDAAIGARILQAGAPAAGKGAATLDMTKERQDALKSRHEAIAGILKMQGITTDEMNKRLAAVDKQFAPWISGELGAGTSTVKLTPAEDEIINGPQAGQATSGGAQASESNTSQENLTPDQQASADRAKKLGDKKTPMSERMVILKEEQAYQEQLKTKARERMDHKERVVELHKQRDVLAKDQVQKQKALDYIERNQDQFEGKTLQLAQDLYQYLTKTGDWKRAAPPAGPEAFDPYGKRAPM